MKIAIVNHDDFSIWVFRRALLRRLVADGHDVHVLCEPGPHIDRIQGLGATWVPIVLPRFITPRRDIVGLWQLYRLFRRHRFDLVHLFQNKIIVYGAIAARLAGVRRIFASSTGVGYITNDIPGLKNKIVAVVARSLYRVALPLIDRVLFQNESDRDHMIDAGLVAGDKTVIVRGSGVSLDEYAPDAIDQAALGALRARLGNVSGRVVVAMVARVVLTKGVAEFIEASRIVEQRAPGRALFVLYGDVEADNPETLTPEQVRTAEHDGFKWAGWTETVREALAIADIVALPSYREGTPRSLLEAMAMSKPIVTTDAPGCRHLVEDGRNGYLVPLRESAPLAEAILRLVESRETREAFGRRSRQKVGEEFEDRVVVARILSHLYEIGPVAPGLAGPGQEPSTATG